MNKIDSALIYGQVLCQKAKEQVKDFMTKEVGGAEIIATIVLVAIVIMVAVLFKDNLMKLVKDLWDAISNNASDFVNSSGSSPTGPSPTGP